MDKAEALTNAIREWVGVRPVVAAKELLRQYGVDSPLSQFEHEVYVLLKRVGELTFPELEDLNGRPWWYAAVAVEMLVRRGLVARKKDPYCSSRRKDDWMEGDDDLIMFVVKDGRTDG